MTQPRAGGLPGRVAEHRAWFPDPRALSAGPAFGGRVERTVRASGRGRTFVDFLGGEQRLAVSMTTAARTLLGRGSWQGRVQSAPNGSVNIRCDSVGPLAWVSLHAPGTPVSPSGLLCQAWPDARPVVGEPAFGGRGWIAIPGWMTIVWHRAELIGSALPPLAPMPDIPARLRDVRRTSPGSLLGAVSAVVDPPATVAGHVDPRALHVIARLRAATLRLDAPRALASACDLLGLGPGLTPAGDDLLVGWAMGLAVSGPVASHFLGTIAEPLLEAATTRTGWLSRAFLGTTLAGHAAPTARAFVSGPDEDAAIEVARLGSTSGADLLGGYLLARHAIAASEGADSWPP